MDVIIVRGQYNTGKTIIMRLLYHKLCKYEFVQNLGGNKAVGNDASQFFKTTQDIISQGATKLADSNDFSARLLINGKKLQLVSHSVNSDEFKSVLSFLELFNPDIVVFCAKEKEIGNTAYSVLQKKLLDVPGENYLEVPVYSIKSDRIESSKNKIADDLLNLILRISAGESLEDIGYHDTEKPFFN